MRAQPVIDALMRAFAEQIEVIVGKHRREAVGVFQLNHIVAEAGAELIAPRAFRRGAREQPGLVNPRQLCGITLLANCVDLRGLGQEGAHDGLAAFLVQSEIVEGIGVAPFDDGVGFGGKLCHLPV